MPNLIDQVNQWIEGALWKAATTEEINNNHLAKVNYAASLTALPDPSKVDFEGEIGLIPALVIFLEIPSYVEGESVYAAPVVAPFMLTSERVYEVVKDTYNSLKEARENQLLDNSETDA